MSNSGSDEAFAGSASHRSAEEQAAQTIFNIVELQSAIERKREELDRSIAAACAAKDKERAATLDYTRELRISSIATRSPKLRRDNFRLTSGK